MRKDGGERGLIKRLGISLHAPAHVLDKLLTEHPVVEFVQLAINPVDWDGEFVQAAKCYEVVRRHGLPVIGMEMVKGGGLSTLPYRNSAPITPDMLKSFEGLTWNGAPTTAILQAYSICTFQRSTASHIRRHAFHVVYSILNLVQ